MEIFIEFAFLPLIVALEVFPFLTIMLWEIYVGSIQTLPSFFFPLVFATKTIFTFLTVMNSNDNKSF